MTALPEFVSLLNKPLNIVTTSNWFSQFHPEEIRYFYQVLFSFIELHPWDSYTFEHVNGKLQVRLSGYRLEDEKDVLDEKSIVYEQETKEFKTFWFMIDDMGGSYIGTFLFPEDY